MTTRGFPADGFPAASMWRYRGLLPLDGGPIRYPLGVGGTPLIGAPALRSESGLPGLWVKDETRGPSASNKDRATALVIEMGLRAGATTITTSSTGNAAVSTAIGAAAAGLRAVIFVPEHCSPAKVAVMRAAGASVLRVRHGYRAAVDLSRLAARELGWLDRNTGLVAATLDAKKTVAFEIFEQLGRRVPDVMLAPVGDGPTLVALGIGFRQLAEEGLASRVPRLVGVQAAACRPIVRAWAAAGSTVTPSPDDDPQRTSADGIAVPEPVLGDAVLAEIRASGGTMVAVDEADIRAARARLVRTAGIISEPAGAAAAAGLKAAEAAGLLGPAATVAVLVTGRDLGGVPGEPGGAEAVVDGDLDAVLAVVAPDGSPAADPIRSGRGRPGSA
jgi:threonine synthase